MLYTLLKYIPGGENVKVAVGTLICCSIGALPMLNRKNTGYDTMADKRAAIAQQQKEAAAAASKQ